MATTDTPGTGTVPTLDALRRRRDEILRVAAQHGASNVRVFGSVARGEADAASDVDLLVDLEAGRSLFDHVALCLALEELLGRRVDVATDGALKPRIRDRVLREALPL
jgi:predicted nucleotidyltransferase